MGLPHTKAVSPQIALNMYIIFLRFAEVDSVLQIYKVLIYNFA